MPRNPGMKVYSSDVDKGTWLIPCRCVLELRCPQTLHGKSSVTYEQTTSVTSTAGSRCLSGVSGKENGGCPGTCAHSFHPLKELLEC